MKTKIIYISGSETFDVRDIRAAFEEVRGALNLDKTTVLFGVPVDANDAGFATQTTQKSQPVAEIHTDKIIEEPVTTTVIETTTEILSDVADMDEENESVKEQPIKKRGRPRKTPIIDTDKETDTETDVKSAESIEDDEKVIPILSVLSTKNDADDEENTDKIDDPTDATDETSIEIIPEMEETEDDIPTDENEEIDDDEGGLEKLLSAMQPLQEDMDEELPVVESVTETEQDATDISVDATLEQLASEFAENQDKIASETKTSSRSKIGKLRNILPFKQSKHKDQGLGDLFGWAGVAANDEEFSVPGFFTSASAKK